MQARPTDTIDLTQPLNAVNEKWLKSYLEAYPDQTFIDEGWHTFDGRTVYLSHCLARRYKYINGLAKSLIKYDVLEQLDQGAYGIVYTSKRTLTLGKKSLRGVDDNNHIVKMTSNTAISGGIGATSIAALKAERNKLTKDHRSRPKEFQHQVYDKGKITLLTMRRFSGQSLQSLIDSKYEFSIEERIKLSIALLRALKEQVHDLNLIHRDIKPGNIIVDINTMEVNIIDFGLCIEKDRPDGLSCGTPLYSSPEILTTPDRIDEKSDIYCMGRVLAQLWGDDHEIWQHTTTNQDCLDITASGRYNLNNLFQVNNNAYKSKDSSTHKIIKSAIHHMVRYLPENRDPLDDLTSQFHNAYLAEHYHPVSDKSSLSSSFKLGAKLRNTLVHEKNAGDFLKTLNSKLHHIPDNQDCIREFTHGLGWHALQSAKSRKEVEALTINIINEHHKSLNQYISLLNRLITILQPYQTIYNTDIFSEFRELYRELDQKIYKITKRPFDFDWLQKSTKSLNDKFAHWEKRLDDVNNDIKNTKRLKFLLPVITQLASKLSANNAIDKLNQLKNKLREALQKYVRKTFTDENIINKDRAASIRRQIDLNDFNNIIETSKDEKSLLKNTEKRISSIETGWFFRSKLKSNLTKVIEQHKKNDIRPHKH